jgi:short-subunit dehydrogenase
MKSTILITGASRGIGFETAKLLASKENDFDNIVLVARDTDYFHIATEGIRRTSLDKNIYSIPADLSDPQSVVTVFDQLELAGLKINSLINNAGFTKPASVNEMSLEDFDLTMRVNVYSPFQFIQLALCRSHPLRQIVNIASTAGIKGRAGWLSYSASKAAMIAMSEVLRDELRPYGVDLICLSPGRCATDLRKRLAPSEDPTEIMQPAQVAEVISMMTTDVGKLLLNQNLVVRS